MPEIDFLSVLHKRTKRDYLARVNEFPKAEAAKVAKKFDAEYWDGDRKFGYGGFKYDGRYRQVAEAMARHYGLKPGDSILDVGWQGIPPVRIHPGGAGRAGPGDRHLALRDRERQA